MPAYLALTASTLVSDCFNPLECIIKMILCLVVSPRAPFSGKKAVVRARFNNLLISGPLVWLSPSRNLSSVTYCGGKKYLRINVRDWRNDCGKTDFSKIVDGGA